MSTTTLHAIAHQIDLDLCRLAARIDQLAEITSRGKPQMDRDLIKAATLVDAARPAVRKHLSVLDVERAA